MGSIKPVSSIAMALSGDAKSIDIHRHGSNRQHEGLDFATAPTGGPSMLLTPPNSISPSLPPQGLKLRKHTGNASQDESDIDLQDAIDHAKSHSQSAHGFHGVDRSDSLAGLDTAGTITPILLAKHHLPEILLSHGPLAIRHIMGYLTTSVPGFSRIPPAKARRLVVSALEGRGSNGEGAGINGDVEFEKVGWGRWDAKRRNGQSHGRISSREKGNISPPASITSSYSPTSSGGLQIPGPRYDANHNLVNNRKDAYGSSQRSWTAYSAAFSHDEDADSEFQEDMTMLENEAEKMSLDGGDDSCSCSSSEAPEDDGPLMDDDLGDDATDDEDWAKIGAAALRQGSTPLSGTGSIMSSARNCLMPRMHSYAGPGIAMAGKNNGPFVRAAQGGGMRSNSDFPINRLAQHPLTEQQDVDMFDSDKQEREAIEALVRLSSV
ncbi:hypothetical protein L228DRAFT_237127 [Xylona heveae TC161]|uniref:Sin3 binding protein n=1 Tax=Xylona heveae (strain CBS 132557 / TC161) TaxID=1328760 RepID=A0A165I076_XYLHT|nr:hypothetical protein L228DRAFT_237127 [Xylona heveae TC161]KZF24171.1 hypothetical protein L228DRAFT_237127 [Xylona heveae TC161]